ncbi:MAG: glycoside hydrolase family 28 protein [Dysgonomonas sp.]
MRNIIKAGFCFVLPLIVFTGCGDSNASDGDNGSGSGELELYGELDVKKFGAVGDGQTDDTEIIQAAIDKCASKLGTVVFPSGTYYTRPLFMKSNVTLRLEDGAVILGSPNKKDYDDAFPNAGSIETSALIYGKGLANIKITGTGKIDGQGDSSSFQLGNGSSGRPKLLHFISCNNVTVENIQLVNSAFWTSHFLLCDGLKITGVKIYCHSNWNNDGIDIDSKNVEVSDCVVDCDDDGICFKSDRSTLCENVTVKNCTIRTNCNAIKFGTAGKGGFKNVTVSDCVVEKASEDNFRKWKQSVTWAGITQDVSATAGIAIESVDGGVLDGATISNIRMTGIQTPIFIRLGDRQRAFSSNISQLKNVTISDVTATAVSKIACSVTGVPGGIIENVTIKNISMTLPGGGTATEANQTVPEKAGDYPENRMFGVVLPAYGFYVRHVDGISFENIQINLNATDARPMYKFEDVTNYSTN